MKKKFILFPLAAIIFYVLATSYESGPGYSGINGTVSGCGGGGCHGSGSTSAITISIQLLNSSLSPVTSYVGGGSYYIRITGTNTSSTSLPRFGFQISPVLSSSSSTTAGSMSAVSGFSHVTTAGGVSVAEQNSPQLATTGSGGSGTTYVATIPWTAPSSGSGSVVVRGVTNAVNYDFSASSADRWNTGSTTVAELGAISGTPTVCTGSTTALSNAFSGGTWSSSNTSVATVSSTGVVNGVTAGTATISYFGGGNYVTQTVTVNSTPGTFGGVSSLCLGATGTITNTVSGGTWTSGSPAVLTIGATTGAITTVAGGTASVTYTIGTCTASATVTVHPSAANTGPGSVCTGSTVTLSNTVSGGTWSSSNTAVGTVNTSTGIVGGVTAGTTNITYTTSSGCTSVTTMTVNSVPGSIGGVLTVCSGASSTATNGTPGGTWSASTGTGSIAVVSGTGSFTGVSPGTAILSYITTGGCYSLAIVTINAAPSPILGTPTLCANGSTTLTDFTSGGTWTSSNTAVATVGAATGIVSGVSGGNATISYTLSNGCARTVTATVNPITPIGGTLSVCPGATTTLTVSPTGGTWSSGSTSVASVSASTGVVSGVSPGTAGITYNTSAGCSSNAVVTVNSTATMSGGGSACVGADVSLGASISGGTWSVSSPANGTIGSTSGAFTGIAAGTTMVSYTTPAGCVSTTIMTVNAMPASVTTSGGGTFCGSATVTASGGSGGAIYYQGTTSGGTSTATPSSSQVVSASGTYYFRALSSAGCWGPEASVTVSINPLPAAIGGTASVCPGNTTALSSATPGGTWSSADAGVASVDASTGVVTGVGIGTAAISYVLTATGCAVSRVVTVTIAPSGVTASGGGTYCGSATLTATGGLGGTIYFQGTASGGTSTSSPGATQSVTASGTYYFRAQSPGGCWGPEGSVTVTINPNPASITGPAAICEDGTGTFTSTTSGGTWSSSAALVATIASSGVATGLSSGVTTISYVLSTGCFAQRALTVNPLPASISGITTVCVGSTTLLSSATAGGTWASAATSTATVGSVSGIVSGVSAGSTIITYMLGTGCSRSAAVTVNPLPATISGSNTLCVGSSTNYTDATPGGSWAASGAGSSIDASGVLSATGTGIATVTYTLPTGCSVTKAVTVNPLPSGISGTFAVCQGTSTTLVDATSGGSWISSNTSVATIGSASGIATGIAVGSATISYVLPTGCSRTVSFDVNEVPGAIGGTTSTCVGSTTTLTNSVAGGTWTSSSTAIATVDASSGVVTGVGVGSANVTYTLGSGCLVISPVTIIAAPTAGTISGSASVCTGLTISLTGSVSGGTWSSSNPSVATIDGSGLVTGIVAGTATMTYSVTGACGTVITTHDVTVTNSAFAGSVSGPTGVCTGNDITLSSSVLGGTWTCSNPSVASIGFTTGILSGYSTGVTNVTYTISSGCGTATANYSVTVNPLPGTISGVAILCENATTTLSNAGGGTWASGDVSVATIGSSSGTVTGIGAGSAVITYTLPTGCSTTRSVTVNPLPAAIGGSLELCSGTTTTLTNASGAGTWMSTSTSVALIGSTSGFVNALVAGNSVINFTLSSTGCVRTAIFTVNPVPAAISGATSECPGGTTMLSSATTGGTWSSSNAAVASIDETTGDLTALSAGTAVMTYTLPTGCRRITIETVNPLPAAITGPGNLCEGASITLASTTSGGAWSSGDASVAVVGTGTGVVSGIAAGSVDITYTSSAGCQRTRSIVVNPLPAGITGTLSMCEGAGTTLSDATSGGAWSSASTAVASIGVTSGTVSGVAGGTAVISYSLTTGCHTEVVVTVNSLPAAISGSGALCTGDMLTAVSSPVGGTWSTAGSSIASIDATSGVITGVAAGNTIITYQLSTGCMRTTGVTVNPLPAAIGGTMSVCAGNTTTLTNSTGGGVWSSSIAAIASIGATTGIVSGLLSGTTTVDYTLPTGCASTTVVTVNSLPAAITGLSSVCEGATITLSSTSAGGTWSSTATSIATISSAGVVSGVATGSATISYVLPTGCSRATSIVVNPLPDAGTVSGPTSVCVGATVTLSATASGGFWSYLTGKVNVSPGGVVTGIAAGADTVVYSVTNVCGTALTTQAMTVNPLPVAGTISGSTTICRGGSTTLASSVSGGTWSSSNTAAATISAGGVVAGVDLGSTTISYTVVNMCGTANATTALTVYPVADAGTISGATTVCVSDTIMLTNSMTGGNWSSVAPGLATVSSEGVVTGLVPGTVVIMYVVTTPCSSDTATSVITVKSVADCTSGVRSNSLIETIKISPNPTRGAIQISAPIAGTLTVSTIDGKEVCRFQVSQPLNSVTLPGNIVPGVYLCRFTGADGSTAVLRLVYEP